jgi:hypothetical protein
MRGRGGAGRQRARRTGQPRPGHRPVRSHARSHGYVRLASLDGACACVSAAVPRGAAHGCSWAKRECEKLDPFFSFRGACLDLDHYVFFCDARTAGPSVRTRIGTRARAPSRADSLALAPDTTHAQMLDVAPGRQRWSGGMQAGLSSPLAAAAASRRPASRALPPTLALYGGGGQSPADMDNANSTPSVGRGSPFPARGSTAGWWRTAGAGSVGAGLWVSCRFFCGGRRGALCHASILRCSAGVGACAGGRRESVDGRGGSVRAWGGNFAQTAHPLGRHPCTSTPLTPSLALPLFIARSIAALHRRRRPRLQRVANRPRTPKYV